MKNRYDMFVIFANNGKAVGQSPVKSEALKIARLAYGYHYVEFVKAEDSEDILWETEEEKKERLDKEWRNPFG